MAYVGELVAAFILAIVTTIAGLLVKHFYNKAQKEAEEKIAEEKRKHEEERKEYERLLKEEQTRNNRQMILDEIEPLVEELNRVKENIKKDESNFENELQSLKTYHNTDKDSFDAKINELIADHEIKFIKIRESYKFRFIQLCKTYLRDGFITTGEWEQLSTMYDLYHSLGGNGQAEDYFDQVKKLEIVPDNE
jgi:phenylalanyl-tRNA synthetase alpha subunit